MNEIEARALGKMSALENRRQNAREAYWDNREGAEVAAIEEAIGAATRVRITPEIIAATGLKPELAARAVLMAGFEAAGFEVVE